MRKLNAFAISTLFAVGFALGQAPATAGEGKSKPEQHTR